jgi:hypothetical protein
VTEEQTAGETEHSVFHGEGLMRPLYLGNNTEQTDRPSRKGARIGIETDNWRNGELSSLRESVLADQTRQIYD